MGERVQPRETEHRVRISRAQARVRRHVPKGVNLSDELIAERRAEARREDEETR